MTERVFFGSAISHYKNVDYDKERPLRITIEDKSAGDAGGLLRQFHSSIQDDLLDTDKGKVCLFIGQPGHKLAVQTTRP